LFGNEEVFVNRRRSSVAWNWLDFSIKATYIYVCGTIFRVILAWLGSGDVDFLSYRRMKEQH
jgi:hypothetical protein